MGTKFMGEVPFSQVYIHGLVRDAHGQKMSKSKGNVLDPIDLIDGIDLDALVSKRVKGMMQPHLEEKIAKLTRKDFPDGIPSFGTDALRFTFAALASNGRDINFDLGRIEGYRNFCNKIWNAARFVQMNTEGMDCGQCEYQSNQRVELSSADRWMISRLQKSEQKIEEAIVRYRFDHAAQEIYDLTWNYYCDWYLELSKTVLNNPDSPEALQIGTRRTLLRVLETILRLAHPIMPFITEDIWQRISEQAGKSGETIMTQPYPESDPDKIDELAEIEIEWVMAFILGVRKIRGEMDISPGKRVPVLIADASADDLAKLAANRSFLDVVGKIESIDVLDQGKEQPEAAITMLGNMKLLIPMAGLIDKGAELARLGKQALQIEAEIQRVSKKLGNSGFVEKAPAVVVQKEQQKLDDYRVQKSGIEQQIEKISAL